MTRAEDERRLWDVLRSKQATVPALADMLEQARAEAWEGCYEAWVDVTGGDFRPNIPNPHRRKP